MIRLLNLLLLVCSVFLFTAILTGSLELGQAQGAILGTSAL